MRKANSKKSGKSVFSRDSSENKEKLKSRVAEQLGYFTEYPDTSRSTKSSSHSPATTFIKPEYKELFNHHIDSFDWFVEKGTKEIANCMPKFTFHLDKNQKGEYELPLDEIRAARINNEREEEDFKINTERLETITIECTNIRVTGPTYDPNDRLTPFDSNNNNSKKKVAKAPVPTPDVCRKKKCHYSGKLLVNWKISSSSGAEWNAEISYGAWPIMVQSKLCVLRGKTSKELVQEYHEEFNNAGGYFITNGAEKLLRCIVLQKQFYATSIKNRKGESVIVFNSVSSDQELSTFVMNIGSEGHLVCAFPLINCRFGLSKVHGILPVVAVLKGLVATTDKHIFERVMVGFTSQDMRASLEEILQAAKAANFRTQEDCLHYIATATGKEHVKYGLLTSSEVGKAVLECLWPFCHSNEEKFDILILLLQKFLATRVGLYPLDDRDDPARYNLLLPGQLLANQLKIALRAHLRKVPKIVLRNLNKAKGKRGMNTDMWREALTTPNVEGAIWRILSTGNVTQMPGLKENAGFSIGAEFISFARYVSHFRSIHKGSSKLKDKLIAPRKLHPSGWGFICPVHTPDGTPCGLLLHLAAPCRITPTPVNESDPRIASVLTSLGVTPMTLVDLQNAEQLPVVLNGVLLGLVAAQRAASVAQAIRLMKIHHQDLPENLEIIFVEKTNPSQFPGLYLFSNMGRFVRPVFHLQTQKREWIGIGEQPFLNIALTEAEVTPDFTHQELSLSTIFSVLASCTPFCDFNQSPRNIYQCQMSKQTMGTPFYSLAHRFDNKSYRIQTPQLPLVATQGLQQHGISEYPSTTNAVVAVLSYTGYDMEDAMIINKASWDRGFMMGFVYKTKEIELPVRDSEDPPYFTSLYPNTDISALEGGSEWIEQDGLPYIGSKLKEGDPFYSYWDPISSSLQVVTWKDREDCVIDQILLLPDPDHGNRSRHARIKVRLNRKPTWGDKFASRHGQKGTLSQLFPQENMPFTESGIVPDIIINPHAFPSRMTIGMLIESLAGKSGAMHGVFQEASSFSFANSDKTAQEVFGDELVKAGYNYYGNEPMYSGITGTEFQADIFIGVVAYQRLRHMIKDKWQFRAGGRTEWLTRQPVHGRSKGGGLRLGEMERDAIISHGAAFTLLERFMSSSDAKDILVCTTCNNFLTTYLDDYWVSKKYADKGSARHCTYCENQGLVPNLKLVSIPHAFLYLSTELFGMGIRMKVDLKH